MRDMTRSLPTASLSPSPNSLAPLTLPPALLSPALVRLLAPFRAEPVFAAAGVFMLLLMLPTLAALAIEPRTLLGQNLWVKPLKFEVSLAVYFLTLAFYARWLRPGLTQKLWYRIFAAAVVFACLAEMLWIGGAAAFGTASHYNTTEPFMTRLYPVMGLLATLITSASALYGFLIWRSKSPDLAPAVRLSLAIGLLLTLPLTLIVAYTLAGNGGHFVGTPGPNAATLPLLGWSREAGDLRVPHFFALHAMHFIPAAGFVVGKVVAEWKATSFVLAFSVLYVGLVAYSFVEALNGRPFLAFIG
ncbi:hypothetical protein [Denitrobaculum tricleocarpae]|uniref:Uncharacterized protein n=1 Tax=Denitrobaculum tricleocarpae TaxID=2591009 RepID=A0A545TY70_9PROT|nr:hypothetical protein [Denitrobaculum tricleocarpae]TQV82163.1 hypothetical protein FKG95_08040 [Denitrobaculum tricleocarpae]